MNLTLIFLIMLALFALNMRLYVGILMAVFAYFVFFNQIPIAIAVQRFIGPAQNTSLLAIPFFIMLGTVMSHTGIAERMIKVSDLLVGRLRGGMGMPLQRHPQDQKRARRFLRAFVFIRPSRRRRVPPSAPGRALSGTSQDAPGG